MAAHEEPSESPAPEEGQAGDGQQPGNPFLVVGVGASAGGLEAFKELLEHLPADPGMAFLYVQHLEPNTKSLLPQILGPVTRMPVREATEGVHVEPNHLYLIPPNTTMTLMDGRLTLAPRPPGRVPHMPADHLFRSLAEIQKGRAVGVILSGAGTDGTLGFQAIKAEGGITFAQDEQSARFDSMPRSAVRDGSVDYVLPPREIARQLLRLASHPYALHPDPTGQTTPQTEEAVNHILTHLRANTKVDFGHYKRTTILRRIRRRMALRGVDRLEDYRHFLQQEPGEVQELYQDLLIRVTRFFRDEAVFQALREVVFPALVRGRSANTAIRVWVAGCSTGEEAYSLAIALLEFLGDRGVNYPVKILASDINEVALERARAGVYPDNIEADVSPERLRRFFSKVDGHYQIGKAVRDLCVFSKHNLASDPPFSRLDLISCRNVLIYLDVALQKRVLPVLHYALNPGGFLLLGSSETIGPFGELFTALDPKHRIYAKNAVGTTGLVLDFSGYTDPTLIVPRSEGAAGRVSWSAHDVQKEADRVVLARYAPVGVVIDENLTVLQFRGRTGAYLEPAPGLASLDVLRMLREGLVSEVRAAIMAAKAEGAPARRDAIPVRDQDRMRLVNVEVVPMKVPPSGVRCYLVLFEEAASAQEPRPAAPPPADRTPSGLETQVTQMQQELAATREYLQSLVEEHESACEELKSASEELLSANEELQSTNEELQTAKEETQSANEELSTLNDELQHRNVELAQANNDLLNLLAAVNIPIVLVSRDLRVRRFTPQAEKVLNLIPTDVGRPITDLKPNLNVPDFAELIARVIDTLTPVEREIQDREGRIYSLRIRPYVTLDSKIDGASITLLDIESIKRTLQQRPAGTPQDPPPAPNPG